MNWIIAAAGIASATVLAAQTTQPQTQPRNTPPRDAQRDSMPQRMQPGGIPGEERQQQGSDWSRSEVTRPGEHHERLEPVIGEWTALVTVTRNGQQHESRGTMKTEWTLGNRFLKGEYTDERQPSGPSGLSFLGYNNAADQYEATWMDTNSTEIMHATGHLEPETRVLTLHGEYTCTMTGNEIPTRIVARMETDDRIIWEMFENPDGERESKTLEIVYTRRDAAEDQSPVRPGMQRPQIPPGQGQPRR